LPSLQLSGAAVPDVTLVGGLNLPSLQLGGAFKPDAALAASALNLPSLQLGGAFTPTVAALSGTLVLPSLQVAGSLAPAAAISGALVLPKAQLAGSLTPTVGTLAGALVLPSLQLGGTVAPTVAALTGALVLPSLQLAGTLTVSTSPVGSWLRLAASTINAGKYDTIANVLVPGNPTNQAVAGRRPTAATSANGLPVCNWNGTNVLAWPVVASNNNTTVFGLHVWVKPTGGGRQRLVHAYFSGAGPRVILDFVSGGVMIQATSTYPNGVQFEKTNCVTVNVWQSWMFLINTAGATNADKLKFWLNGTLIPVGTFYNMGTGDLSVLAASSGSYLLGGSQDIDTANSNLVSGTLTGPNWHFFNAVPTQSAMDAIRLFEVPT